ncbi:MAG: MFS transporter [Coriobacteriales bacterium]|nr:MFS transporter [Coriobacteriales bacterium]
MRNRYTVSSVIDALGVSRFTLITFFFLGFAMVFDGYDYMIINVTNTNVATSLLGTDFDRMAMGTLTTWSVLGMVVGGATGGILSDRFGRKTVLVGAIAFYALFTLPQAFAQDYLFFALFRTIAGFGIGSCIPVVTTIFSETMPTNKRGLFITFGMAFMVGGWVLAGVIGGPINNATNQLAPFCEPIAVAQADGSILHTYANWRIVFLIGAIPLAYALLLLVLMKETPHWYANSGRISQALERLNQIERSAGRRPSELDPKLLIIPPKPAKTSPTVLLSRRYILITCGLWSTYFIGQFCIYGMNTWLPTWFRGIGYSPAEATALLTWNNVAAIVSNISVGFVSDLVGRRRNLGFAWLFAIGAIVLCSLFVVPGNFVLCIALMLLFGFALNYAITAIQPIMPESYPTQIRNMGVSWSQAFARLGAAISPVVLGGLASSAFFAQRGAAGEVLVDAAGKPVTDWSMLVLVLVIPLAIAFVCTLVFIRKETKGISMDQLQEEEEGGRAHA